MAGAQRWGHRGGSYKITSATAGGKNLKFMGKEDGAPPRAENAHGGKGEDNVVHGQMDYLEWCGILRGNKIQVGHMPANTKRYKRHMNETGFVSRSLRINMRSHNGDER